MGRIWPAATPNPDDRYTPVELRHLDAMLLYPGEEHPLVPRAGISPRGGVAATISGLTVTVRDLVGVAAPTEAPWSADNGTYRFVLYSAELSVDPPHASLTRTDLLVARLTDTEIDGSGTREATAVIITGTPGAGAPDMEAGDLHLSTVTVPPSGATTIAPSGLYTVALGGVLNVPSADALPASGMYTGQFAYATTERALYAAHGTTWDVVASRRGYQWGETRRWTTGGNFVKADYPGLRAVRVKVQAGGGGGGGSRATTVDAGAGSRESSSSGGGGGGCYAEAVILASSLPATTVVTVGSGGSSPAGGRGNAGGSSAFGSFIIAPGGEGGYDRAPSTGHAASTGGAMSDDATITGHVAGTDLVVRGGAGGGGYSFGSSIIHYSTVDKGAYGHGGSSFLAGTGRGARGPSTTATPGQPYGGGGSGNVSGHTETAGESAKSGGAGAAGIVIVELLY